METIIAGLAIWSTLFLLCTTLLGLVPKTVPSLHTAHMLAGIFTAVFGVLAHTLVLIHAVGTGKWIAEGLERCPIEEAERFTRKKKWIMAQLLPLASFGTVLLAATAILGGAHYRGSLGVLPHSLLALAAIVVTIFAFAHEVRMIRENRDLLREVEERLDREHDAKDAGRRSLFEAGVEGQAE